MARLSNGVKKGTSRSGILRYTRWRSENRKIGVTIVARERKVANVRKAFCQLAVSRKERQI